MLLKRHERERIASGEITVVFRRWKRPTVKSGGTLRTASGVLAIDDVRTIEQAGITITDARRAGFASCAELVASCPPSDDPERQLYRIAVRPAGPDPRIELRSRAGLGGEEAAEIAQRLARFDGASPTVPWTRTALGLIAELPGVRAPELAARAGLETARFKRNVRKLKELGLTESLEVGYRLSPRGRAFLGGRAKSEN